MFCHKVFETENARLLAVCDADLSGKTLSDDDFDVVVHPSFYGAEKVNAAVVLKAAKKSTIINALCNDIVNLLVKENLVEKSAVISIGKVKHAQVVTVF